MTILTIHKHDQEHLEEVKKIAEQIGSVEVKAYYDGETMYCLEGVHRVQAAYELELPIIFKTLDWDAEIDTDCEDIADENGKTTVAELVEYAYDRPTGNVYDEYDFVSVEVIE